MLIIVFLIVSSVSLIVFTWLFLTADNGLVKALINCLIEQCIENGKQAQIKLNLLALKAKKRGLIDDKKVKKEAKKLKDVIKTEKVKYDRLTSGKIGLISLLSLAGYRVIQILKWDSNKNIIKSLYNKCIQYKEKKEAMNYCYYLVASLISCTILSIVFFGIISSALLVAGSGIRSLIVSTCIMLVIIVIGYIPYDNVQSVINDRKEQIERQFPQVVSKMALLTVAGMEVSRAWELTSKSGTGTLYEEMNRVIIDFSNNVNPEEAYSKFIRRCNRMGK